MTTSFDRRLSKQPINIMNGCFPNSFMMVFISGSGYCLVRFCNVVIILSMEVIEVITVSMVFPDRMGFL